MSHRPVTNKTARYLAQLVIIGLLVQIGVIVYVFYSSYQGRVNLSNAQQAGCSRSKLDRVDNALGWRNAEAARRQSGQINIANEYGAIASSLEARSRIDCKTAFPDATLFP